MNGLTLTKEEFMQLPQREQMTVLFENQQRTIQLISGYKFYQKISAIVGGFIIN